MRKKQERGFRFESIVSEFREAMSDLRDAPSTPDVMLRVYTAMGNLYCHRCEHHHASHRFIQGMKRHAGPERLEYTLGRIFHQFGIRFSDIGIHDTASHDFSFIMHQVRTPRARQRLRRLTSQLETLLSTDRSG